MGRQIRRLQPRPRPPPPPPPPLRSPSSLYMCGPPFPLPHPSCPPALPLDLYLFSALRLRHPTALQLPDLPTFISLSTEKACPEHCLETSIRLAQPHIRQTRCLNNPRSRTSWRRARSSSISRRAVASGPAQSTRIEPHSKLLPYADAKTMRLRLTFVPK